MYNIEIKYERNYLVLTLNGFIPYSNFLQLSAELVQKASTLKPGFGVITDIRNWESCDAETTAEISTIMKKLTEIGMKAAVRVIKNATQDMLASFQKANIQAGYLTRYFIVMEDAEKFMQQSLSS